MLGFVCRLKKIQKKKAQRRADKEKELAVYKASHVESEHDTGSGNNLIEDDRDEDLLFEN